MRSLAKPPPQPKQGFWNAQARTSERAAQSLDYWQSTTQALLADPDLGAAPRDAYVKQILGQANLFVGRNLSAEVEQAFQLATRLSPASPQAVFSYVALLAGQHRYDEARQMRKLPQTPPRTTISFAK